MAKEKAKAKAKAKAKPKPMRSSLWNPTTGKKKGDKALRPKPGLKLDKETIISLLLKLGGNISATADAIGCNRQAIHSWVERDPDVRQACHQARERKVDKLEETVWDRAVREKDTSLQIFLLKTIARKRGYEQNEAQNTAKDIATAAFDFIVNQAKDPE